MTATPSVDERPRRVGQRSRDRPPQLAVPTRLRRARQHHGTVPGRLRWRPGPTLTHLLWAGLLVLATVAVNRVFPRSPDDLQLFWPASGVGLAWLVEARRTGHLRGAVAALTATVVAMRVGLGDLDGASAVLALAQVVVPVLAALVLGALTRRVALPRVGGGARHDPGAGRDVPLGQRPDLRVRRDLALLTAAGVLGSAAGAPLAGAAAALAQGSWDPVLTAHWAARTTLAAVINGATLLLVLQAARERRDGRPLREVLVRSHHGRPCCEAAALLLATVALATPLVPVPPGPPGVLLLLACTVWAGTRFTPVVAAVHTSLLSALVVVAASHAEGIFGGTASLDHRAVTVTMFVALAATMAGVTTTGRHDQQELTATLVRSRDRYQRLLDHLDDNIWSVEVTPDGVGRLVFSSQPSPPHLGGHRLVAGDGDAIARMRAWLVPEDRPLLDALVREVSERGSAECEWRVRGVDGSVRWTWVRATGRHHRGVLLMDGITSDITALKAVDEMRNQFVAVVGHELRTPLTVIRGNAELLADRIGADPVLGRQVEAITRRAEHLELLIGDFSALATYDGAGAALDRRPVDLSALVRELVQEHPVRDAGAEVVLEADVEDGVVVAADRLRLRQALDNLVDNALKYGRPGGRARVEVRRTPDGRARVAVDDDGIGVPAHELPLLFERFFRASNGRETQVLGTGLGLAVVRSVVEAHGGSVSATAGEHGGLRVELSLPGGVPGIRPGGSVRLPDHGQVGGSRPPPRSGHGQRDDHHALTARDARPRR